MCGADEISLIRVMECDKLCIIYASDQGNKIFYTRFITLDLDGLCCVWVWNRRANRILIELTLLTFGLAVLHPIESELMGF